MKISEEQLQELAESLMELKAVKRNPVESDAKSQPKSKSTAVQSDNRVSTRSKKVTQKSKSGKR